jgi:hypothetical protein
MTHRILFTIIFIATLSCPSRAAQSAGGCALDSIEFHRCAQEKARSFNPPKTVDGIPNFQGYWTARHNGAVWDIEPRKGQGSLFPATTGVIVDTPGRKIPYQPWALAKRDELRTKPFNDPKGHCAPVGSPRDSFTNYGLRITQPAGYVVILYEQMHDYKIIPTSPRPARPESMKLWHSDPLARMEGNTLVIENRNVSGKHWYDMSGNFQSENTRVTERYTLIDPDTIHFEAHIEDPTLYTTPWTIAFALTRNKTESYYQLEFACHEGERDMQHYTEEQGKGQSDVFVEPVKKN